MDKTTSTEAYKLILQNDYCEYVSFVHDGSWLKTPFHTYLCDAVQDFVDRKTNKPYSIMCIHTPPQHGKSTSITETLPSWYLGKHPTHKVIEVSYGEDFALMFGRRNREKIEQYGQEIFGIQISKDKNTAREFELTSKGSMISRGVGTAITGRGANLIIIDDPIKNSQEANSELLRNKIYHEWIASIRTRVAPDAKVIVIMTRWHEDDLVGRLLKEESDIEYLCFPCECEDSVTDPLHRPVGDALLQNVGDIDIQKHPEIAKGNEWLKQYKRGFLSRDGAMAWNAMYQGRPTALEGNLIKREWWKFYEEKDDIQIVDYIMSVDATFKDKKENDFVSIQIWGKHGANMYLIDAVKKHLNFPDTVMEIRRLRGMYRDCKLTLIEDKANGSAIITMLKNELVGIIPVMPMGSKISRVQAIIGAIESGNVYLPKNKKFTAPFIEECAAFPNGKHDDQVDAMSQALNRIIYQRSVKPAERVKSNMERMFPAYFENRAKKGHGKVNVI